ncbi:hypothetical protein TWF694_005067 [Orbilia ellipsospora]|uniref:Uncharacterized protein n=1 Tax=Orbilia ellipsospora TaxID=2528407 RepID=A0AAV9WX08_9PEZI
MPCVASEITKTKPQRRRQRPYGAGYIIETHFFGLPDIFQNVKFYEWPESLNTAYVIDYESLLEHRELGESSRLSEYPLLCKEICFNIYVKAGDDYDTALTIYCQDDETIDDLVDFVIVETHNLKDGNTALPREDGFSFDLLHKRRSLFREINEHNRNVGERMLIKEIFRKTEHNLVWKV